MSMGLVNKGSDFITTMLGFCYNYNSI